MVWFFKKRTAPEKQSIFQAEIPRDEERLGPAPPPPPSATPPGVTVLRFGESLGESVSLAPRASRRPAETRVLTVAAGASISPPLGVYLLLSGSVDAPGLLASAAGDVLVLSSEGEVISARGGEAAILLADVGALAPSQASRRIGHEEPVGTGFGGITGARRLDAAAGVVTVRLGPPPGARWAIVGLRALAVFVGKLSLVDGDEAKEVRAGRLAVIADPSSTLYLQAGNDSVIAMGFASPDAVIALG
ncbi:MAG TPA: hypothetical protein VGR00_09570 [Thermoanaerobaculia bacterium]|nr:hypothetical protein [Thermoanaerobaculia bacterium]